MCVSPGGSHSHRGETLGKNYAYQHPPTGALWANRSIHHGAAAPDTSDGRGGGEVGRVDPSGSYVPKGGNPGEKFSGEPLQTSTLRAEVTACHGVAAAPSSNTTRRPYEVGLVVVVEGREGRTRGGVESPPTRDGDGGEGNGMKITSSPRILKWNNRMNSPTSFPSSWRKALTWVVTI